MSSQDKKPFLDYINKKTPKTSKSTADEHEDRFNELKAQSTPPKIKAAIKKKW